MARSGRAVGGYARSMAVGQGDVAEADEQERARRLDIGRELRSSRLSAGLTISELAERTSISSSKLSRLERGRLPFRVDDIRTITSALELEPMTCKLLVERVAVTQRLLPQPSVGQGASLTRVNQREIFALESSASLMRDLNVSLLPGKYQTADYVRALYRLEQQSRWRQPHLLVEEDDFLVDRMQRQALLNDRRKRFVAVVMEQCLLIRVAGPDVLCEQFDHLITLMEYPNIEIRLVPIGTALPTIPSENTSLIDSSTVVFEDRMSRDLADLRRATMRFEMMSEVALEGEAVVDRLTYLKRAMAGGSSHDLIASSARSHGLPKAVEKRPPLVSGEP